MAERNQARVEARTERQESRQEVRTQRVEREAAPQIDRSAQRAVRQEQRAQRQAPDTQVQAPAQVFQRAERRADRIENRQERREDRIENRQERRGDRREGNIYTDREAYRDHVQATRRASERSADQTIGGRYERQAERNQQRYEERLREDRREVREDRRDYRQDRRDYRQAQRWDRNWRSNSRYDWQSYRYSNRNLYRGGSYYSPYRNHRYSRLTIGFQIGSGFYSDSYWLNDPWQYRLPHAYPGTRWIRYYDDVLLVDTYSGEVLDVIYDFFW
jgi:hypothetical protein